MAKWSTNNFVVTDVGKDILNKVAAGIGSLVISSVKSSGGYVETSTLHTLSDVTNFKQNLTLVKTANSEAGTTILVKLDNTNLSAAYDLYQIGIYVTHSSYTGEQLYMIAQCDILTADNIPLPSESLITNNYTLLLAHSGISNVSITVNPAVPEHIHSTSDITGLTTLLDVKAKRFTYTASLLANNWTGNQPYTQTVNISGILSNDLPHIQPVLNSNTLAVLDDWACVSRIVSNNGSITATCYADKPISNINLQIEVIR